MFGWALRYLGLDDPLAKARRAARLSEDSALKAARRAAAQSPDAQSLHLADIVDREGEVTWVFATASRGSSLVVEVRDRDCEVIRKERVGGR